MNKGTMLQDKVAVTNDIGASVAGVGNDARHGIHTSDGWTPETIAERVLLAMKQKIFPLESSNIVFSWDPI